MAAGSTYTPIATNTVAGTSTTTVTFSSIPSTYTDILMIASTQNSTGGQDFKVNLNGSTSGYSITKVMGDGTNATSGRRTSQTFWYLDETGQPTTGEFMVQTFNLMNYANTTTYKTAIWRNSYAGNGVGAIVGLWQNTSAVNQIEIITTGGTMKAGTTFTLYGIAAA